MNDGLPRAVFHGAIDAMLRADARACRSLLAEIVDHSHDAILCRDLAGTITTWNGAAEQLLGYSADEAIGRDVLSLVPDDRRHEETDLLGRPATEHIVPFDTVRLRNDGTLVPVLVTVVPVADSGGAMVGAVEIVRELFAGRGADPMLRRTEEQLRQAQKMEAIGRLAGGIAHDFNNVLSVILGFSDLVLENLSPADPLRTEVQEICKAGLRAKDLTRQLLAFSRRQVLEPRILDFNAIVAGMDGMLRRVLGEDIAVNVVLGSQLGRVRADPGQIEQVILNLAVNAREAMPDGGNLTIETANMELDTVYAKSHLVVAPGSYVMIAVTDTGHGMDRATQAHIFEPFFTTKDVGGGTGLGLATVYGIVKQSGGYVWVYSEPGQGTTFKIYLPRTDAAPERPTATPAPPATLRGTETILLVEDDDQVRTVTRMLLRRNGYQVIEAQNGGEAFLVAEQFNGHIDLLLTDVVMPRLNGRQLADRLVTMRPFLNVLYMSGYTEDSIVHHGMLGPGIAFIQKPLTPEALLRKVREILDSGVTDLT